MSDRSKFRWMFLAAVMLSLVASIVTHFESRNRDLEIQKMRRQIERLEQEIDSAREQVNAAKKAAEKLPE